MAFRAQKRAPGMQRRRRTLFINHAYIDRVLGTGPVGYWPMWETAGVPVENLVNPAQPGAYVNAPTLANGTAPGGSACPWFDGAADYANFNNAVGPLDETEGTMAIWARAHNAGVWTDGQDRILGEFGQSFGPNDMQLMRKTIANNTLYLERTATAVTDSVTYNPFSSTDWFHAACTWSESADELKFFVNGSQVGLTQVTIGAWGVAADIIRIASADGISEFWHGWLAHFALWDTPLPPATIENLATV